jgi:TP901 family phage tail tape measure protein
MPNLDVAINALRAKHGAKEFDSAAARIKRNAKKIDNSVDKNTKSFNNLGGELKRTAVGLVSLAAAYKGLRFAQSAVKEMAVFEMELANVSTMLDNQTMSYLPGYEKQLSNLAKSYGQSTGTLSKGLYDILSASISASDAIEVLEVASKAAIGGLTDTGTAADALTTIINAYGMEAEDATRVSDILFATVKRGKITFGELAGSIGKVIALAASAGLSFEQASAAIATMTRAGISADIAMTALKGIVTTFLSPQKENIEVAKKFKLVLNANTLETEGLTGALGRLKTASTEETAAIFSNVRALLGVAATRKSLNALIEDYEGILNSSGMAEIAYHKIARTTAHELAKNHELWLSIKRDLGKGILPEVNLWLQGMNLLVKDWKEGWSTMAKDQKLAQAEIEKNMVGLRILRIVPAFYLMEKAVGRVYKSDIELTESLLQADKAMKTLDRTTEELSTGLDRISKMDVVATPIDLDVNTGVTKEISEEQKKAGLAITQLFKELEKEKELIGLTNEERERAAKLLEFETQAKILSKEKSAELVEMYKGELEALQQAYDLQEFSEKIGEGLSNLIRSPLTALLDETRDIGDVLEAELRNLGISILESMYEEMITQPLKESLMKALNPVMDAATNLLSSLLSGIAGGIASGIGGMIGSAFLGGAEKGRVISNGSFTAFDKGGIINKPTIFPMSNGGIGLAGERDKEAIMPLNRDASGRLGVISENKESSKTPLKIINVVDQSMFNEYLGSGNGERRVINILRRNSNIIKEIAGD